MQRSQKHQRDNSNIFRPKLCGYYLLGRLYIHTRFPEDISWLTRLFKDSIIIEPEGYISFPVRFNDNVKIPGNDTYMVVEYELQASDSGILFAQIHSVKIVTNDPRKK